MSNSVLPFPRSETYSDRGVVTMNDTAYSHLEGMIVTVPDTIHNTLRETKLRVVKNDSGAAITVGRKMMAFSTTSVGDIGGRVSGIADTAGQVAKPLDDAYIGKLTSIPDNDLFYVGEAGLFDCLSTTTGVDDSIRGVPVSVAGNAKIGGAAANHHAFGWAQEPVTTAASTGVVVLVQAGLGAVAGASGSEVGIS